MKIVPERIKTERQHIGAGLSESWSKVMFKKVVHIFTEHKILRGMISYAVLWPVGSLIEQTLVEKRNLQTYDWKKCLRCNYTRDFTKFPHLNHIDLTNFTDFQ